MKKEEWAKLKERDRRLLKKIGMNSLEDTKKPLWKRFEEADIDQRIRFIYLKNPNFIDKLWQFVYIFEEPKNFEILNNGGKRLMKKIEKGDFYEIEPDKRWRNLYSSFRRSKEWTKFRKIFLAKNKRCIKCGNIANTPHHKIPLNRIVLKEGFLKSLEKEDNFESYCQDCHAKIEGFILQE